MKTALSQPRRSLYRSPPTLDQQRAGLDKSSTSFCETPPHATVQSLETSDDTSADVVSMLKCQIGNFLTRAGDTHFSRAPDLVFLHLYVLS